MNARCFPVWLSCSLLVLASGPAGRAEQPAAEPLQVSVGQPLLRQVADHEDFTGRTEASSTVEIRARVTGYLVKVLFKDGAEVKRGDLLFEIDPRPYQAELAKAEAGILLAEARLKRAETDFKRASGLLAGKSISQEDFDKIVGDRTEAEAMLRVAKAGIDAAKLTLDFTRVTSPISGRISRRLLDPGNLVKGDETLLTTIIVQDPIYAYFDVGERTALRLRNAMRGGAGLPVTMGLADEKDFPRRGTIDFADNRFDPKTGTLRIRAVFDNAGGTLLPGMFVRVRLTGEPHKALLVPEQAVAMEKGKAYLFIVDARNVLERRPVELGSRHDGLRVVKDGLKEGERIVLGGLGELRAGMTVKPRKADAEEKPEKQP